jgi:hypothetical protein
MTLLFMHTGMLYAKTCILVFEILFKKVIDFPVFELIEDPKLLVGLTFQGDLIISQLPEKLSFLFKDLYFIAIGVHKIATLYVEPGSHNHDISYDLSYTQ